MRQLIRWSVLLMLVAASSFTLAQGEVYYEIFIRSFQDSDGDGIGDIQGVIDRLDYLEALGVTGVWLMPIHPSPSYHGYDVTDYYDIHPDYGNLADFELLLEAAQQRNIKVIIDLVVNHTSVEHPWFIASTNPESSYRDYYLWSETDPGWRDLGGGSAWHAYGDSHYLGLFWRGMPDLNYRNPAVVAAMKEVAAFWIELGVDGFRVDAIQHIVEGEDGRNRNTPETFAWVRDFSQFLQDTRPESFMLGETWTDTQTIIDFHEAHLEMSFNYPLFNTLLAGLQRRNPGDLAFMLAQDERLYPANAVRANFISNHDQVRPATTLGALRRDEQRMKLAAGLLLTLPGVPFIYYGEEIGLPNGPGERDEEKRTPMPWNDSQFAGFSNVAPWYDFSNDIQAINVAQQRADGASLWRWYQHLIALRKSEPALYEGAMSDIHHEDNVLMFRRSTVDQSLFVLANFSAREVHLSLEYEGTDLLTGERLEGAVTLAATTMRIIAEEP